MALDRDEMRSIPPFPKDDHDCFDDHSAFEILLGKEKYIFNHAGNKRFRAIINHNVHKYDNAPTKSAKTKLVRKIHCDMQQAGFRFLKRDHAGWHDLKLATARDKLSHALRDRVRELRRPSKHHKKSLEDFYPTLQSMASILEKNQLRLQSAKASLIAQSNFQSKGQAKSCKASNKTDSGIALLDIVSSISNKNIASNNARSIGKKECLNSESNGYILKEKRQSFSTVESLFGGLANEIADAGCEDPCFEMEQDAAPIKYITISKDKSNSTIDDYSSKDKDDYHFLTSDQDLSMFSFTETLDTTMGSEEQSKMKATHGSIDSGLTSSGMMNSFGACKEKQSRSCRNKNDCHLALDLEDCFSLSSHVEELLL